MPAGLQARVLPPQWDPGDRLSEKRHPDYGMALRVAQGGSLGFRQGI